MRWSLFGLVSLLSLFAAAPQASAAEDYAVLIISRERLEVPTNCEIGLYVNDQLAGRLFQALKMLAREQGVERLYLHTHPFLPGAIEFWQRQGFVIVDVEDDPLWR
ncbi:GNAT family N-acetyltransferase, partial [Escherichia coli]